MFIHKIFKINLIKKLQRRQNSAFLARCDSRKKPPTKISFSQWFLVLCELLVKTISIPRAVVRLFAHEAAAPDGKSYRRRCWQ